MSRPQQTIEPDGAVPETSQDFDSAVAVPTECLTVTAQAQQPSPGESEFAAAEERGHALLGEVDSQPVPGFVSAAADFGSEVREVADNVYEDVRPLLDEIHANLQSLYERFAPADSEEVGKYDRSLGERIELIDSALRQIRVALSTGDKLFLEHRLAERLRAIRAAEEAMESDD